MSLGLWLKWLVRVMRGCVQRQQIRGTLAPYARRTFVKAKTSESYLAVTHIINAVSIHGSRTSKKIVRYEATHPTTEIFPTEGTSVNVSPAGTFTDLHIGMYIPPTSPEARSW